MALQHFKKYPFFYTLLVFNVFWSIIRTTRWAELQQDILPYIIKCEAIELIIVQLMILAMIGIYSWSVKHPPVVNILCILLISLLSPSILYASAYGFKSLVWPEGNIDTITFENLKNSTYYNIFFFITLGGIFFVTHYRINFIKQRDLAIQSKALANEAHLKMLRYQINPHFLFNILNSLHALVDENQKAAKKLIVDLSEYYRLILDKQISSNSLKQEIEIARKFLEIQKIRFEENFTYKISTTKGVMGLEVPVFIIQILLENAIKYGKKGMNNILEVELNVSLINNALSIVVMNSGSLDSEIRDNPGRIYKTGTGLDNVKQRLLRYYGDDFSFSLSEAQGNVIAQIDIENMSI